MSIDEFNQTRNDIYDAISRINYQLLQSRIGNKYGVCHDNNYLKAKEEYEMIFYDKPIIDKEVGRKRYLLYEAWGISASEITYDTEFINKTKDMYLNVIGKAEDASLGFENDINVHLYVDTNIYDGFEVSINNGMVKIILHEIENEKPTFRDLSFN